MTEGRAGPLRGIRVLDLGQIVAGPFAASLLADYGADVVKVERPGKGDPLRALGKQKDGVSLWWHACNRNKRTIALDLANDDDRATLRTLIAHADAMVENYVPGTLEKLGFGYDRLAEINPGLVLLRVSGYGQEGPYSRWPGFARTSEAFSGLTHLTGFADRPPVNVTAFPVADYITGLFGAFAIVSALRERDAHSGRGQVIDLALHDGLFRMMELGCISYDQLGFLAERNGGTNEVAAPVGIWPSQDGMPIQLAVGTDAMAKSFFAAIGQPDLIEDPRYATNRSRVLNRAALETMVAEWLASRPAAESLKALSERGVAAAPVMSMDAIFKDPQYAARGNLAQVDDAKLGKVTLPGVIPRLSRTPGAVRHAARDIDADRASVLRSWSDSGPD
ncbi:CaiB/BaiF CoA transferase family protein [Ramlibacter sp.]|uniref:CaiB/BaiF CoA transferase family protein n=1 Tax=Ramlibacter sp. TaxID=1917967 RepID=UPI003D0D8C2B